MRDEPSDMKHILVSLIGGLVGAAVALVPAIYIYGQQVRQIEVNTRRLDKIEDTIALLRDRDAEIKSELARCCSKEKSSYSLLRED